MNYHRHGLFIADTKLTDLSSVYNGKDGTMHLLDKLKINVQKIERSAISKDFVFEEISPKIPWKQTKSGEPIGKSIEELAGLIEFALKEITQTSAEYVKQVKQITISEANKNYVLAKVAVKELIKNPSLAIDAAIGLASTICAQNGLAVSADRVFDAKLYLNAAGATEYTKSEIISRDGVLIKRCVL